VCWRDHHEQPRIAAPSQRSPSSPAKAKATLSQYDSAHSDLLHNHPSGDPTRSQADIQMMRAIIDIATPLSISVHGHIIVGKNGHASMKGLRLI
jgi:DNA repair protein RadC